MSGRTIWVGVVCFAAGLLVAALVYGLFVNRGNDDRAGDVPQPGIGTIEAAQDQDDGAGDVSQPGIGTTEAAQDQDGEAPMLEASAQASDEMDDTSQDCPDKETVVSRDGVHVFEGVSPERMTVVFSLLRNMSSDSSGVNSYYFRYMSLGSNDGWEVLRFLAPPEVVNQIMDRIIRRYALSGDDSDRYVYFAILGPDSYVIGDATSMLTYLSSLESSGPLG